MKYVHLWMNRGSDHRCDPFWQNTFPNYFAFNVWENYFLLFLTPPPQLIPAIMAVLSCAQAFSDWALFCSNFYFSTLLGGFLHLLFFILFRSFQKLKWSTGGNWGLMTCIHFFLLTPPARCKIPNKSEQVKLKNQTVKGNFLKFLAHSGTLGLLGL